MTVSSLHCEMADATSKRIDAPRLQSGGERTGPSVMVVAKEEAPDGGLRHRGPKLATELYAAS